MIYSDLVTRETRMRKAVTTLILGLLSSTFVQAGVRGKCTGMYRGQKIVFSGISNSATSAASGRGSISVGGRVVADFEGVDLKINYLFRSFKVRNNHGAMIEGEVTDLAEQRGMITRLYVPEYGIDFRHIPMSCTQI